MSNTNKSDIRLIQLNNYVRPTIVESKFNGYVKNGKKPTEFYDYVIDRYKGSPTNAAINNSYIDRIYGKGLSPYSTKFDSNMWVMLRKYLKPKDVKAIATDYQIFGEASIQIIEKRGGEIESITHIAQNLVLPSISDEDDNINSYWFSRDWNKTHLPENKPEEIPAFDISRKQPISIYKIRPYGVGNKYFRDPDYASGLTYAELEEEISNFYINHIKNGLSFGYIINIPDGGVLSDKEKSEIEKEIKRKLTGSSNAGKFIINFSYVNSQGAALDITVTPLKVNDAHKQWEYLTKEARQQLFTAHKVTSPMLFGVKDNTGLGSNANEYLEAEKILERTVIEPKRQPIIDAFEEIFLKYNIGLKLKFSPLYPVEKEEASQDQKQEDKELEKVQLSEKKNDVVNGEEVDLNEWELIDEIEVDYEEEEKLFKGLELASTGVARPNAKSSQDGENFIVRYVYRGNKNPEREFCKKMMQANKVYRKEDILQMGKKVVNAGWGANGADTYSIWLYKGGGDCHHKWHRQIYLKKGTNVDVNSPLAEIISTSEARRRGMKIETNDSLVSIEPRNMTNRGFLKPR